MKYTDYYKHLMLNESWKTYVPSSNPKIMLYDFYVLSYLSTLPISSEQKGFRGNLIGRDPSDVKLDIEHAESVLLPVLVKKLKNALFFAICSEIRHLFDKRQDFEPYKNNRLLKHYVRYYRGLTGNVPPVFAPERDVKRPRVTPQSDSYLTSYKAAMMAIEKSSSSKTAFAELARRLFKTMEWDSSYGGSNWASICDGYLLLEKAQTNHEKQVAIDHAYDLQHNTGTALNKVSDFKLNGSFDWIKKALDHKRYAASMYELLPECSSDMRKLALEAFKIAGVKNPQSYRDDAVDSKNAAANSNKQAVSSDDRIMDMPRYGCTFFVNSTKPDANIINKFIAQGFIHHIYDLERLEKLNNITGKELKVGDFLPIYTDYLFSVPKSDLDIYYAKDTVGNLLKVGKEYLCPESGVQGKLIKINHGGYQVKIKITSVDNKDKKYYQIGNMLSVFGEKLVPVKQDIEFDENKIYNMPIYGCLVKKQKSPPGDKKVYVKIHYIYRLSGFSLLEQDMDKKLYLNDVAAVDVDYIRLDPLKNPQIFYQFDADGNPLKVGNIYKLYLYGATAPTGMLINTLPHENRFKQDKYVVIKIKQHNGHHDFIEGELTNVRGEWLKPAD